MEQILEKWKTCAIDSPIWNKIVLQTWSYGFLCWLKDSCEMGKWVEITFEELLLVFFKTHDPTTLNMQGNDVGTQYRSVVFFENQEQKLAAENMIDQLEKDLVFERPIVTEVTPVSIFYSAENYHQDYYEQNKSKNPYCKYIIEPKLKKLKLDH
jgi:peptide-methionine (S)-S-oxide reductase